MQYTPEIDGLRAFAIIPGLLFHSGLGFMPGGFVGVDIFFVISGYLISTIIFNEIGKDSFTFSNFWIRRARRILPASIFMVLLSIILFGFSANADEYPNKPIEIVIHAKYGGGTDTTARMASIRSRRILKTDIRIVSKRGGAGAKAQNYVLTRPADG